MTDDMADPDDLHPTPVGARLVRAREAAGRDLNEIAAATRIPLRHLEAIESGEFEALPSPTYAVGFVRAYARTVGLDEVDLAARVREEMDLPTRHVLSPAGVGSTALPEPRRIPPSAFAWTAAAIAVLLLAAFAIWRTGLDDTGPLLAGAEAERVPAAAVAPPPAARTAPAAGPVVLTATDEVWVRVRDGAGTTLVSRTLQPGERVEVPADAAEPSVTVGRPEALTVTVGGQEMAPLGPAGRPVNDVPLTPGALTAANGARAADPGFVPAPGA